MVQQTFCERDAEAILEMPLSQTDGMDKLIWKFSKSGEFTVRSTYKRVEQQKRGQNREPKSCGRKLRVSKMWKRTWSLKVKGKIKHFLWRLYHNLLPTNQQLAKRRMPIDTICKYCGKAQESVKHIFFQCQRVRKI